MKHQVITLLYFLVDQYENMLHYLLDSHSLLKERMIL